MTRRTSPTREVLRWTPFLALPGVLWGAFEMYILTASGPQMLFFTIAHTMPLLVLAVWVAAPTGAAWIGQCALSVVWDSYRTKLKLTKAASLIFVATLVLQGVLLETYEDWSSTPYLRVPLCCIGLAATAILFRTWLRFLAKSPAGVGANATSEA